MGFDYFVTYIFCTFLFADVPAATTWTGKSNIHCNIDGGVGRTMAQVTIPGRKLF